MRYLVLGPLHVHGADVTAARDRTVLAVLLLDAGRRRADTATPADDELAATLTDSEPADAESLFWDALRIATDIRHPYEQGRAHAGLARCLLEQRPSDATRHLTAALEIFERMGVPERLDVRDRLDRLERGAEHLQAAAERGTMDG
jgi:hypothetical protein